MNENDEVIGGGAAGRNEVAGYGGHLLSGRVDAITPHPAHPGAGRMSFDIRLQDGPR